MLNKLELNMSKYIDKLHLEIARSLLLIQNLNKNEELYEDIAQIKSNYSDMYLKQLQKISTLLKERKEMNE